MVQTFAARAGREYIPGAREEALAAQSPRFDV